MRLPLFNRLKKRLHRDIAMLQDEVVDVVYSVNGRAILHGGTAVWRCYSSDRFSEDLDFYLGSPKGFKEDFFTALESRGFSVSKYKRTANTVFSRVSNGVVEVRFEAALRKPRRFVVADFERVDGTRMSVFTLSPEGLLLEKIAAYQERHKIRDLYDIFILSSLIDCHKSIKLRGLRFLDGISEPEDEKSLKALILSGAVPSFDQMVNALKRRFG